MDQCLLGQKSSWTNVPWTKWSLDNCPLDNCPLDKCINTQIGLNWNWPTGTEISGSVRLILHQLQLNFELKLKLRFATTVSSPFLGLSFCPHTCNTGHIHTCNKNTSYTLCYSGSFQGRDSPRIIYLTTGCFVETKTKLFGLLLGPESNP